MKRLATADLVRWRAAASLILRRARDPSGAVGHLVGLQAQEMAAGRLAVRARSVGGSEQAVTAATQAPPTLVRTWAMRGTLHLVAAQDVRWLAGLLGPRLRAGTARRRRELGIPDERCEAALPLLDAVLADGPLDRASIVRGLLERGFPITPGSQAVPHLLGYAAAGGSVCCAPGETFALVERWVPAVPSSPQDPLAELARRYLAGHAPAAAEDFASWSGLPLTGARQALTALGAELCWWDTDLGPMATLAARPPDTADDMADDMADDPVDAPIARLLPRYDDYLLGWRDRDLVLDPRYRRAIHPGGGILNAALTIDGVVRGRWRLVKRGRSRLVRVEPFAAVSKAERASVEEDAADVGRFLQEDVSLDLALRG